MSRYTRLLGLAAIFAMLFSVVATGAPNASAEEVGVNVDFPMGALFQDLTGAGATFEVIGEGDCTLGSPRFAFGVDTDGDGAADGYVVAYLADFPNYDACTDGNALTNGENVVDSGQARWDTSQVGGTFYDTFANALALVGSAPVTEVIFVSDSTSTATPWVEFDYVAPVTTGDVEFTATPTDGGSAEGAAWAVYDGVNPDPVATGALDASNFASVGALPYGDYILQIDGAAQGYQFFETTFTVDEEVESFAYELTPLAVDPEETDGTVIVSKFYCDNIDEVIFQVGTTADVSAAAIPTSDPACEPGYGLFTFYLVGDGTNDYAQLEVDGSGSIGLPAGEYEVVEEGTLASTFIEVIAGENTTLVVQNPIADVAPTPAPTQPGVTPTPAAPGTDGSTDGGTTSSDHDHGKKAASTTATATATTSTVTTLPSTGAGAAEAGQSIGLLLAAVAGVLVAGAAAVSIRSRRA